GRNQRNAVYWMAKRGRVDYGRLTRLKIVNVDAEERAGVRCNLEPRLRTIGSGNDEYHSSSNRACGNCLVVFNLESCFRRCRAANRNLKKNDSGDKDKFPHSPIDPAKQPRHLVFTDPLEIHLERKLNNARIDRRIGDDAKRWRRHAGVWVAELRVIEGVEELTSEFDIAAFTNPLHRCPLEHRYVEVILAGTEHDPNATVSEFCAIAVCSDNRPGGGACGIACDASFVEIVIQP